MESLFGYDTHRNFKVILAEANGAQVTFLLSSMFAEETVKTCTSGKVIGRSCYAKKYIVFESQVLAWVVGHICCSTTNMTDHEMSHLS